MTNIALMPERDEKPVNALVGMNVGIIMQLRGKTQKELALALGVNQTSMSRRISGVTDWSPDEMQRVATILNVKVSRLFEKLPDLDSNQEPAGFGRALAPVDLARFREGRKATPHSPTHQVATVTPIAAAI